MPTVVSFPDVEKTFQVAMSEVLNAYFGAGSVIDSRVYFPLEIHYNVDKANETHSKPRLVFAGRRFAETSRTKCKDPETNDLVHVIRGNLFRTVYLTLPRVGVIRVGTTVTTPSIEVAHDAWANVCLVMTKARAMFSERNISSTDLSPFPVQVSDNGIFVIQGMFSCKIQYVQPRN